MSKEDSNFADSKILMSVCNSQVRRQASSNEVMKTGSRWPFTVDAGSGAMSLPPADNETFTRHGSSSFIT